jgi:hypothetical protein
VRCYSIIVSFIVRPRESTTYLVRLLGIERARLAAKYEVVTPGAERHRNATAEENEREDIAVLKPGQISSREGRSGTCLLLALEEEVKWIVAICHSRADEGEPVEDDRRQ